MFSLILTVTAIALAVLLVVATLYYGGGAFMGSSVKVTAQTVFNQSLQIAAARTLAIAHGRTLSGGALVTVPEGYLSAMPTPPAAAYKSATPSANDWEYYLPGTSSHFGVNAKLSKKTCMEINKAQGFVGIPAAWDGVHQVQCFGPTDTGYTYIFEPAGQSPEGHIAAVTKAVDDAKTVVPTATPGYPRLCPDNSTITAGVCAGASAPVAAASGFWIIQATVDNAPIVESLGFAAACPTGAINPNGPGTSNPLTKPGEPLNADSDIVLGWELPPDYVSVFTEALSRTWCIPANESDVLKVGRLSGGATSGYVADLVETIVPAHPNVDLSYTGASTDAVVVTAAGVQWTVLATGFYTDTWLVSDNKDLYMTGRKVAIGKVPTATFTYFVNSPSATYDGRNFKVESGTVMFNEPLPPCLDALDSVPFGTGGAVVDIQSFSYNTAIRKQDGSVWLTGPGYDGIFSRCTTDDINVWTLVAQNATSMQLISGVFYIVKSDGSLWASGYLDNTGNYKFRKLINSDVKQVAANRYWLAYLKTDGTLWYRGQNMYNERGDGTRNIITSFEQVDSGVASISSEGGNIIWLKSDKSLWVTGLANYNKLGATYPVGGYGYPITPGGLPLKIADDVKVMRSMFTATVYVKNDGTVFASGYDQFNCGFFGRGSAQNLSAYTQIGAIAGLVVDVRIDYYNIRLLGADGRLWAAGCNGGAFGNGSTTGSFTFTQIASGVKMFAGGGDGTAPRSTIYLDQADVMYATGTNVHGQFGNGTNVSTSTFGVVDY